MSKCCDSSSLYHRGADSKENTTILTAYRCVNVGLFGLLSSILTPTNGPFLLFYLSKSSQTALSQLMDHLLPKAFYEPLG